MKIASALLLPAVLLATLTTPSLAALRGTDTTTTSSSTSRAPEPTSDFGSLDGSLSGRHNAVHHFDSDGSGGSSDGCHHRRHRHGPGSWWGGSRSSDMDAHRGSHSHSRDGSDHHDVGCGKKDDDGSRSAHSTPPRVGIFRGDVGDDFEFPCGGSLGASSRSSSSSGGDCGGNEGSSFRDISTACRHHHDHWEHDESNSRSGSGSHFFAGDDSDDVDGVVAGGHHHADRSTGSLGSPCHFRSTDKTKDDGSLGSRRSHGPGFSFGSSSSSLR